MSIDVLSAAATRESAWLATQTTNYTDLANAAASPASVSNLTLNPCIAHCYSLWQNIPQLKDVTSAVNVSCICDVSGGYGTYVTCTVTVPAGATLARFMIWGAGAGSGGGNCCSFAPSGANGAFASVIMPVVPGEQYVAYAGGSAANCQYCCGCCIYINNSCFEGTKSYVTGPGLCNFCAEGGNASLWESMKARACSAGCQTYIDSGCCKFYDIRNGASIACGGCICAQSTVCMFGYSLGPYNCVNHQGSYTRLGYGCTTRGYVVWTIPSIYNGFVADSNNYGAGLMLPTYSPIQTPACFSYTTYDYTSPSCLACGMGINWCTSYCVPGAGGFWSHNMGGTTAYYGDRGRGGKVCIQFLNM